MAHLTTFVLIFAKKYVVARKSHQRIRKNFFFFFFGNYLSAATHWLPMVSFLDIQQNLSWHWKFWLLDVVDRTGILNQSPKKTKNKKRAKDVAEDGAPSKVRDVTQPPQMSIADKNPDQSSSVGDRIWVFSGEIYSLF